MEHAIHLCAGYFITDILPTSVSAIIKKIKFKHEETIEDSEDDEDSDEEEAFSVGDVIRKALALIKQV